MNIQSSFALAIKQIRQSKNISQEKFALQIGMDRTYYSSVEAGKRNISIINIQKIADGFNTSISYIFELAERIQLEEQ